VRDGAVFHPFRRRRGWRRSRPGRGNEAPLGGGERVRVRGGSTVVRAGSRRRGAGAVPRGTPRRLVPIVHRIPRTPLRLRPTRMPLSPAASGALGRSFAAVVLNKAGTAKNSETDLLSRRCNLTMDAGGL